MTRELAVRQLMILWIAIAIPVIILLFVQSLAGKYGQDSSIIWNWIIGQLSAPMALTSSAHFSDASARWKNGAANVARYKTAMILSILHLSFILLSLFIEPLLELTPFELIEQASFLLSIIQGLAVAAIGSLVFEGR